MILLFGRLLLRIADSCRCRVSCVDSSRRVSRCAGPVLVVGAILVTLFSSFPALGSSDKTDTAVRRAALESGVSLFDQAQQLLGTDAPRARRLFESAAQQFESIVSSGVESGPLEYNLGNCYLQAGDTGRAILHYRRALRLIPNDPKLRANLREARRRCLTSIPPSRERRVLRDVFFWHYQTTEAQRLRAGLFFYVVFWLMLAGRAVWRRRWQTVAAWGFAVLTVACGASLMLEHWQARNAPAGVVTALDVSVNKGPGPGYPRQFEQPLQPGTEFTRLGQRAGWWEIELPDGKSGWIDGTRAELVDGNIS